MKNVPGVSRRMILYNASKNSKTNTPNFNESKPTFLAMRILFKEKDENSPYASFSVSVKTGSQLAASSCM